ncbi:hypothetical protein OBBRIDRAFT_736116 [Obba rivulosa]|uniref:Protein kinase domain-containing protein n=1 Tax=Obba rivulosa TaxID=1052685 RepID=A0A8E2DM26_9APHY|nr:hypothetical protein OBBRIDRAFT_736116 [Obba rivulosa]
MVETYGPPVITGHRIPPFEVAIKWVQNNDLAVEKLHHEADMYAGLLHPLQGYLVPICYGFFVGEVDGAQVACLVLERCKSSTKTSNDEMIQRQRAAAIGLHRMGVVHGNLLDSRGSHFLIASDGSLRIIDFTESKGHECDAISTPSVELHPVTRYSKCDELYWLHKRWALSPLDK